MRIVSLLASGTEIVCALGAGEWLVGRSHECDNPEWVTSLPACSEPAFDISVSSGEIDREVTRRVRAGEPLYRIHTEQIRELAPDVIIAQSHCEVCAVTPGDVERGGACFPGTPIVSVSASRVEDVFESMIQIAAALGLEDRGLAIVAAERDRLERVRAVTRELRRPTVAVLEWVNPIYPIGNWTTELIEAANSELALGMPGQHTHSIPAEQLRTVDPEYIIIAPCGFDLRRSIAELPVLRRYPWWSGLRAVCAGNVAFADGNLLFNRSGMTVARTAEVVAEMLHGVVSGERSESRQWVWIDAI